MSSRWALRVVFFVTLVGLVGPAPRAGFAQTVEPITYTVKFPAPTQHRAEVEAVYPTQGRPAVTLMMPIWSPGFYRVENYAGKVQDLSARTLEGKTLKVEQPKKNRWIIATGGTNKIAVSYKLQCDSRSVTTNWVGEDMAVLNGAAAFLTLVENSPRPHDIQLQLAGNWKQSMTGLDAALDGKAHHYRAADFDALVDSPIVAGNLDIHEFEVAGSKHLVVNAGDISGWDGKRAAADLEKIVKEHRRMWGFLPFQRYLFLCVFRRGGGGLEHRNSTLLTASAGAMRLPASYLSWLIFVSHEYFHAFNVKRLRPVELGPFDYEKEPRTAGLWVAEGITCYYDALLTIRAGLAAPKDFLARLSGTIARLQKSPGRLVQTLEQASRDVWTSSFSGIGGSTKTVSYYVKGPVVAFLLDAEVRRATQGAKTLDDVMKLAYQRYSGAKGFTPEQFRQAAEEVAGVDLQGWFQKAINSTEELDYAPALDWFGLRFAPGDAATKTWRLEIRDDATEAQRRRIQAWLEPNAGRKEPKKSDCDAKPTSHTIRNIEGWKVRIDDRLLKAPGDAIGTRALRFLENKLADIKVAVPRDRLKKLQEVSIVLDLTHGKLRSMQYHPSAGWLKNNGYSVELAKCVHLPRAADLATRRNIVEQPWVILHELAHAYHDQVMGFDEPRIKEAYEKFKKSGHGEKVLLVSGRRMRHYALTNPMEFFAEMTESYFGVNDFFPFNRAELKEAEPEIHALLQSIWEAPPS